MSFSEKLSSVPNLLQTGENLGMQYFENLLAVPKPAIYSKKPWMSHFPKRPSVPNHIN